jgi:apolipoprotein N-acyltransferase
VRLPLFDAVTRQAPSLTVGLVQTNIGARDKATDPDEFILRHRQMSQDIVATHPQVQLIVWPESAYNHLLRRTDRNVADRITNGIDRPVIFGALTYGAAADHSDSEIYNSVLLASASGDVLSIYDKVELLAFGETLPFSDTLPVLGKLIGNGAWFTRGTSLRHLQLADISFLPMICYEDILPALVRRIWQHDGPADVLVNVTNDSWYGDTHQPMLHLVLASFRSIETRRALIRSTNTGISAIIDPAGRITHRTRQWQRESLIADVPLIKDGSTTLFMRVGNVVGWLCLGLTAVGYARCRRVTRRAKAPTG